MDNVGYTPGLGATVAADEIGGILFQRVKPVTGVDGVAVDVSSVNPMPVTGSLTITGTSTVAGSLSNNTATPAANNVGVLPAVANAAAVVYAEGNQVLLSTDLAGSLRVTGTTSAGGTLSNNTAAPAANNVGVLPAIANAAAPTYAEGNQVLVSTDLAGALRITGSVTTGGLTDAQLRATPVPISGTVAVSSVAGTVTVAGGLSNNTAAPAANNVGALTVRATAAAPAYTEGNQVLLSTDLAGSLRVSVSGSVASTVSGSLSNNTAAPAANNVGVLPAIANAAAPTYVEGNQVLVSTDLAGALRITGAVTTGGLTDAQLRATPVPVSGTVAVSSVAGTVAVSSTQLPAALVGGRLDTNIGAWLGSTTPTVGQKTMAASLPVVIASDQSAVTITGSVSITGTVTVAGALSNNTAAPAANNIGALTVRATAAAPAYTEGNQVLLSTDLAGSLRVSVASATVSGSLSNNTAAPAANNVGVLPAIANAAAPTYAEGNQVLVSTDLAGALRVTGTVTAANASVGVNGAAAPTSSTQFGGSDGTNLVATRIKAASTPAVAADPALVVAQRQPATGTQSSVASSATNVTILAANTARLGATVYNDSTKILYLKLGATASTTSFTTQLAKDDYYEVPFGYTGIIDGLWAAVNGNARVTELT